MLALLYIVCGILLPPLATSLQNESLLSQTLVPIPPDHRDGPFSTCTSHNQCSTDIIISDCICGDMRVGDIVTLDDQYLSGPDVNLTINPSLPNTTHSICFQLVTEAPTELASNGSLVVTVDNFYSVFATRYSACFINRVHVPVIKIQCEAQSQCKFNFTYAYYTYSQVYPTPTPAPSGEYVYTTIARIERSKISCQVFSQSILIPETCEYECTNSLEVMSCPDGSLELRSTVRDDRCSCSRDIMKIDVVGRDYGAGKWQHGSIGVSINGTESSDQILISFDCTSQYCSALYSVVWGGILGVSVGKSDDQTSDENKGSLQESRSSVVGIVFCAILISGGVVIFARKRCLHKKLYQILNTDKLNEATPLQP